MLYLKSLILRTAIDPELTRVRASLRREDRETTPTETGKYSTNSRKEGWYSWMTRL